jgi:bacillithiol system protein YtxJ
MLVELHQDQDLDRLLERSRTNPIVVFKHSTQCSRSAVAYAELEAFADVNPDIACGTVLVIENRELSDDPEDRFGIVHESPQAIVVANRNPIWHASHSAVTARALQEAISTCPTA